MAVELDGPVKTVATARGKVATRDLLFAGGGYIGRLVPALARSFIPIATYVLLTEAAPERIRQAIRTTDAVSDNRRAGDYYRCVAGGERILWGGKITTRISDPRDLAERLRRAMVATYPQLEGVKVEAAWSGLMSYARHLMPQIGQPAAPCLDLHRLRRPWHEHHRHRRKDRRRGDHRRERPDPSVRALRPRARPSGPWDEPRCSSPIGACRRRIGGRSAG